ncbi:ribonuclease III [Caulobacter sp. 17J80-11]|uniref:ribonuclease III n=1 Tax=Caulobacter sp. 17J80-11 TaxID=2763502 RepID=UPI00165395C6|nr:ribonuclease III [Caulobacter sp. 17J80-11]MBC6980694.1 ribonuclease III [Caulobacter sp. 17J80-11]
MSVRAKAVADLEQKLGHVFNDRDLLERALTHSSVGEGARRVIDYERLEFLGDRVLGLLAAERLIDAYPKAKEGELSPKLQALVNREACARAARRMGVGPALRLSPGETKTGGRDKDTILGDACEALMAAVYIDGGMEASRAMFGTFWADEFAHLDAPKVKDVKSRLQEWAQGKGRPLPTYEVVNREGPDHAPTFTVEVKVEGVKPERAAGRSRQEAEKAAATAMLEREGLL